MKDILRWSVRERTPDKSLISFPVVKQPLQFCDPPFENVVRGDRGVGIVRTDTQQLITTASSDYALIPHTEVCAAIEAMFEANGLQYELYDVYTGGSKGNRMYVNYTLPQYGFDVDGDTYIPFVQAQNSYDRFILLGLVTGIYRTACWNGNLWGTRGMQFTLKKHVVGNITLTDLAWNIDSWGQNLGIARINLQRLLREPLSETTVEAVLAEIFAKQKDRKNIAQLQLVEKYVAEVGNNMYALFNACTDYATHVMSDSRVCKNYDKARKLQMAISDVFVPAGA